MKFTPEVVAALKVLRDNAESDFERHRIDVLERDLTAPPTVEVIDDKHQRFNGENFHIYHDGHMRNTRGLHQRIWNYFYGEVPNGYQIHHVDGNKLNNDISNLQIMTISEHQHHHNPKGTVNQILTTLVCEWCGKKYQGYFNGKNRFCSQLCRSRYRQTHERIQRTCPQCGKIFDTPKAQPAQYCSHTCAMDAKRKYSPEKRTCPVCGKEFVVTLRHTQKFCSRECAVIGRSLPR